MLEVHFIDVGQGDATLIIAPGATILIDTGRHDSNEVLPYLRSQGVSELTLLIGTHGHSDHIGQFPQVIGAMEITEIWLPGEVHTTDTYERALDSILASDAGYHEPRAGESYSLSSLFLEVVSPVGFSGDQNNSSIALRLTFGSLVLLFTGDAETDAESGMLARGHNLSADILHIGHHGSATSTTPAFLAAVDPQVSIYSAGQDNQYGHPARSVVDRIRASGSAIYGTDVHGTIILTSDGSAWQISTERTGAVVGHEYGNMPDEPVAEAPDEPSADCVNINTASWDELQLIIHIGPVRADDIIRLRPFATVRGLTRVSGIGPARIADIIAEGIACVR